MHSPNYNTYERIGRDDICAICRSMKVRVISCEVPYNGRLFKICGSCKQFYNTKVWKKTLLKYMDSYVTCVNRINGLHQELLDGMKVALTSEEYYDLSAHSCDEKIYNRACDLECGKEVLNDNYCSAIDSKYPPGAGVGFKLINEGYKGRYILAYLLSLHKLPSNMKYVYINDQKYKVGIHNSKKLSQAKKGTYCMFCGNEYLGGIDRVVIHNNITTPVCISCVRHKTLSSLDNHTTFTTLKKEGEYVIRKFIYINDNIIYRGLKMVNTSPSNEKVSGENGKDEVGPMDNVMPNIYFPPYPELNLSSVQLCTTTTTTSTNQHDDPEYREIERLLMDSNESVNSIEDMLMDDNYDDMGVDEDVTKMFEDI